MSALSTVHISPNDGRTSKKRAFNITLCPRLEYASFGKGLSINARISALVKARKLIEDEKEKGQKAIEHGKITERKRKLNI